ncbi:hypothetical protein GNY06_04770 [Elizabethkingia argentiflava]|uniref:LHH domain-containing protein n=1 Tax=Elizabethkingia argenteiflava TaxID=2681556 RepID=A0A845PV21_9FLAO|nr:hypothetical protein [Elizabethkingia argenteiflava]
MSKGYYPIGSNGRQINLHHILGQESGLMIELLQSFTKKNIKNYTTS